MKINEVANLTGVTIRTLQYYDKIDLLKPCDITAVGYRLYDKKSLETLQQILFFREMDFSLDEIKKIINNPNFDQVEALKKHKELLLQKRNRLDNLINLVNHTLKGESSMNFKAFDTNDIEATKKKYATEVKERWGNTPAYSESQEKTSQYDARQWGQLSEESQSIFNEFSQQRHTAPDTLEVQALVKKWQAYITKHFYTCTDEILSSLGQMYINDERFTQNIDKHGEGTAAFMAAAIESYCTK